MKIATILLFSVCLLVVQSAFGSSEAFERYDSTSNETVIYTTPLSSQYNVSVQLTDETNNVSLSVTFPPLGNYSADYSLAGSDIADYQNPNLTDSGVYRDFGFFITLFYQNGTEVPEMQFDTPVVLKLNISGASSDYRIFLYNTTSKTWEDAAHTCPTYFTEVVDGLLVVNVCHFTQFGVFEVVSSTTGPTRLQLSSSATNSGLIAAVIIVPILIVLIIIGLVAWALLRNPKNNNRRSAESSNDVEMKKKKTEEPKQVELNVSTSNEINNEKSSSTSSPASSSDSEDA